jgi:hypothetical protein
LLINAEGVCNPLNPDPIATYGGEKCSGSTSCPFSAIDPSNCLPVQCDCDKNNGSVFLCKGKGLDPVAGCTATTTTTTTTSTTSISKDSEETNVEDLDIDTTTESGSATLSMTGMGSVATAVAAAVATTAVLFGH